MPGLANCESTPWPATGILLGPRAAEILRHPCCNEIAARREALRRIGALYEIETDIRGRSADERRRSPRAQPPVGRDDAHLADGDIGPYLRSVSSGPGHPLCAQSLGPDCFGSWTMAAWNWTQTLSTRHASGRPGTEERFVRRGRQRRRHWSIVATLIQTAKLNCRAAGLVDRRPQAHGLRTNQTTRIGPVAAVELEVWKPTAADQLGLAVKSPWCRRYAYSRFSLRFVEPRQRASGRSQGP